MTSPSTWAERAAVLLLVGIALLAARPADACTSAYNAKAIAKAAPDVFAWHDSAASAAELVVTASPGHTNEGHGLAGSVDFTLVRSLKGTPPDELSIRQQMKLCDGYSKDQRVVVFFDDKAMPIGFAAATTAPALIRWRDAKTPAARKRLLAELAKSKVPEVSGAATKQQAAKKKPAP